MPQTFGDFSFSECNRAKTVSVGILQHGLALPVNLQDSGASDPHFGTDVRGLPVTAAMWTIKMLSGGLMSIRPLIFMPNISVLLRSARLLTMHIQATFVAYGLWATP